MNEMSDKNRRQLLILGGVGAVVVFVLAVVLIALLVGRGENRPENAFEIDREVVKGEQENKEALEKLNALMEREPVLRELPLKIEFYSNDFSSYTKYIISYVFDSSEARGFYLVVKDYTGVSLETALTELVKRGMDVDGVRVEYEDYTGDSLSGKAVE